MNNIMKTKQEKYISRYQEVEDLVPKELEKWEKMSALAAIRSGLVRSIHFITP